MKLRPGLSGGAQGGIVPLAGGMRKGALLAVSSDRNAPVNFSVFAKIRGKDFDSDAERFVL